MLSSRLPARESLILVLGRRAEKAAFEGMIRFLYAGTLSPSLYEPATDVRALVALLLVSDKFDVPSLMGAVCEHLRKADGPELFTRVPPAIRVLPLIKELMNDAASRVVAEFQDVSGTWELQRFKGVSFEVVEVLLQSEDLEADSEEEIFDKLLAWVAVNYTDVSLTSSAIAKLASLVRFPCMSGEYLETLLTREELQAKETQDLINAALKLQAYSDVKKQEVGPETFCQRKGVRNVHLEIVDHFLLDESGTRRDSRRAVWFGKKWYISVQKDSRGTPPSVGLFLYCEKSSTDENPSARLMTLHSTSTSGRGQVAFGNKLRKKNVRLSVRMRH